MTGRDDPLGRRALFTGPDPVAPPGAPGPAAPVADPFAPERAAPGRRALFGDAAGRRPPAGRLVCRRCGRVTPLTAALGSVSLLPWLWVPWRPASVRVRCQGCHQWAAASIRLGP